MTFGKKIVDFYTSLEIPSRIPAGIEVMLPFRQDETLRINKEFYKIFYNDNRPRIFLIGINPGRFGAGLTGIPFTDPVSLEKELGINNSFDKKHELSSRFIYSVISRMGGAGIFYGHFYFTAVSPLGFVSNGRNINYYDTAELMSKEWEDFYLESLRTQINAGADTRIAYSLGTGKNIKYLHYLNDRYKLFNRIIPLPHPRWIMQYRYKRREQFADEYSSNLNIHLK